MEVLVKAGSKISNIQSPKTTDAKLVDTWEEANAQSHGLASQ